MPDRADPHTRDDGIDDLDETLRALTEIGVGAAILALRRVNIARRRLVDDVPAIEPAVDAALDGIEAAAEPASAALGALVSGVGEITCGPLGDRLRRTGPLVAAMGPELLRLSGLTRRS